MFSLGIITQVLSTRMIKQLFSLRCYYVLTSRKYIRLVVVKKNSRQMMNEGKAKKLLTQKIIISKRIFFIEKYLIFPVV